MFQNEMYNSHGSQDIQVSLPSQTSFICRYHLMLTFLGITLSFSPMHFVGFNVMPRRMSDF